MLLMAYFFFYGVIQLYLVLTDPFGEESRTKFPGTPFFKHRENDPIAAIIHCINRAFFVIARTSFSEIELSQASFSFYELGELDVFHELYWHISIC
jgi:hypothetical protein